MHIWSFFFFISCYFIFSLMNSLSSILTYTRAFIRAKSWNECALLPEDESLVKIFPQVLSGSIYSIYLQKHTNSQYAHVRRRRLVCDLKVMTTVNEPSILSLTNHCQQNWDGLIWLHLSSDAFSSCRKVEPRNIKVQHTHTHTLTLSYPTANLYWS